MSQHPRPTGPTAQNNAATFSLEMSQGCRPPERSRFYSPVNKLGVQVSQTTHVEATFAPNMTELRRPERTRYDKPRPQGWQWQTPEVVSFDVAMTQGSRPDSPRILLGPKIPLPVSQTTHVQADFGPDMVTGSHPDANRAFVPPKIGWNVTQTTHVSATFSVEMTLASRPDKPFRWNPYEQTGSFGAPDVQPFPFESVIGCKPDTNRQQAAKRGPSFFPWSGSTDADDRAEFWTGYGPDQSRQGKLQNQGWQWETPEVVAFSIETVIGNHPDKPRIVLGPRIPLPVSQVTHVAAPFNQDMLDADRPETKRYGKPFPQGWQWQTPEVELFSIEMVAGSKPDKPRLTKGHQEYVTISQTTHTVAPFSFEMAQGSVSVSAPRRSVIKRLGWAISILDDIAATFLPDAGPGQTWYTGHRRSAWVLARRAVWILKHRMSTWKR